MASFSRRSVDEVRRIADRRPFAGVGGRRRRRRGSRRRRRRRRLDGGARRADLDLAAGGQPAVVGGQLQVELRDRGLVALRPGGRLVSTLDAPMVSWPQSPTATLPPVTGWPSTRRFTTVVPFVFPPAPDGPVPADARAVTASAVISPLKSDTCVRRPQPSPTRSSRRRSSRSPSSTRRSRSTRRRERRTTTSSPVRHRG